MRALVLTAIKALMYVVTGCVQVLGQNTDNFEHLSILLSLVFGVSLYSKGFSNSFVLPWGFYAAVQGQNRNTDMSSHCCNYIWCLGNIYLL